MSSKIFMLSAAAAMLAGSPVLANAESLHSSTMSPISIKSAVVNEVFSPAVGGDAVDNPTFTANGISLEFVNTSSTAATAVTFLVTEGRHSWSVVDKGIFRPGAQIDHNFGIADGSNALSDPLVNVSRVDFADGSAWPGGAALSSAQPEPTATDRSTATSSLKAAASKTQPHGESEPVDVVAQRAQSGRLGTSL